METKIVLDTYKRYLRTLNCSDAELFTNYKTMTDFIERNCEDNELVGLLVRHCIGKTLNEIRKRGIRVKDYCKGDWDALAIRKGCRLIENIKKYDLFVEPDAYRVNSYNFGKLADKQNPYVQLFLYLCFADRLSMFKLFEPSMKEIEEAASKASELSPTEGNDQLADGDGAC